MFKRLLLIGSFAETAVNVAATILTIGATALAGIVFSRSAKTIKDIEDCETKENLLKSKYEEAVKRIAELEMIIQSKDAGE